MNLAALKTFPKVATGDPAYLASVLAKWADVLA